MTEMERLHEKAMALAEQGILERLNGNIPAAEAFFRQAYEKESQAAKSLIDNLEKEPTRSILFRSAASLALDCNENREAERLVALGLLGNPPDEIADELRSLNERASFERHLKLRGIVLAPEEFQLSMAGKAVSGGITQSEPFIMRIDDIRRLLRRTVERMLGISYREGGLPAPGVRDYGLFISVPRVSSFAVSLKVSYPGVPLPGFESNIAYVKPTAIVDEIITCLDDFTHDRQKELKTRIHDEAYYRNFVGIAKNLSPDGEQISQVGFTSVQEGEPKGVQLTRTRASIKQKQTRELESVEPTRSLITITGSLLYANELRQQKQIIIVLDDDDKQHKVVVPKGMMSDIVKPLWEERVIVSGFIDQHDVITLENIDRASD
ncbi:MAG: hypothetical protein NTZ34_02195 [Chloroflexi bacterium]|nr:hypothetical protein [Chloroflexota bacterium]